MEKEVVKKIDERLTSAIDAVIKQQIAERDPRETLETLERLQEEGFSEREAYTLIGHLVSLEVAEELRGGEGINLERYIAALERLPEPFAEAKDDVSEDEMDKI